MQSAERKSAFFAVSQGNRYAGTPGSKEGSRPGDGDPPKFSYTKANIFSTFKDSAKQCGLPGFKRRVNGNSKLAEVFCHLFSWSENPDSAASMFSPSLNVWEETFMDLESVCAMKSQSDMVDATKHMNSVVADDELNTPIIGNEFSFNPSGVVSRDVISSAPCLNFGNVSDSWENLYISPRSVTNIEEEAAQKEPCFISDMCFNPVHDDSVIPLKVEGSTLKFPAPTQTTEVLGYTSVPPTSVQNSSIGISNNGKTGPKSVAEKVPVSNSTSVTMVPLAVAASPEDNIQIVYHPEELQSVAGTSTANFPAFTEKLNMTAEKDSKRKELKLNLAPVFSLEDISTPVVFEALDADGNVNLMEFIANDDFNPASDSDLDVIQYIIGQTEEEAAEKQAEVISVLPPSPLLHVDDFSNTTTAQGTEATFPVKVELISDVHEDEADNVEVWEVKGENTTPQMGLKLKILKQKNNKSGSESKRSATKRSQGKRVSSRRGSDGNKSDDYCYDDDDDDEEYFPTKRSKTTQRRRLTSASSSSSISRSPGTSRQRSSVSQVADIEERYRELRDKNNEASRKSRLNRKARETEMQQQVQKLEQENQTLRIRADELEKIVAKLRESLVEIVKNPRR